MLEYQSLKWNNKQEACACESVTPVCFERDFSFFYPKEKGTTVTTFEFLSANGDKIDELQNEDTIENDAFGFAYLPLSNRIAIGDYFRIRATKRYPSEEKKIEINTDDYRIISSIGCGYQLPALQFDEGLKFIAERNCEVAISAFCEFLDNNGARYISSESDTFIYTNCNNIANTRIELQGGEELPFVIVLPTLDTTKHFVLLKITCYFNVSYIDEYKATSSLMQRVSIDDFSQVNFNCTNDEFGFPFSLSGSDMVSNIMPIKLSKPQYSQNDKIYTKSNGENVVLFSEIVKEYEGTTDYVNEKTHEMILIALSCDEVYINGEKLTKSDKYEIDWDNYTTDDSGEKLARATFKMKANVNRRNSNC